MSDAAATPVSLDYDGRIRALRRPVRRILGGATWRFIGFEFRRLRTRQNLVLSILLPAVLYLALSHIGDSNPKLPHGDFASWMMIGIALYGAAASATSSAAGISLERGSGWMRTLRLSPVRPVAYIIIKVCASVTVAALPVAIVGVLAAITGAHADPLVWVTGLLVAWLGSAVFAALGLALGLSIRPETVMHLPGVLMTALAFLGNLFIPLTGPLLQVSMFTPMYGVATVARYALTEGRTFSGESTPLWGAALNIAVWFALFVVVAARRYTRTTGRQ